MDYLQAFGIIFGLLAGGALLVWGVHGLIKDKIAKEVDRAVKEAIEGLVELKNS